MPGLLLTSDLACSAKVSGAASRDPALTVDVVMSVERLLEKAAKSPYPLIVLDLNTPGLDCAELLPKLKQSQSAAAIVAFGPHVHEEKLKAAADAGCTAVLSRGQFFAQVEQILSRYLQT